jgi:ornithine cyclodeaminase
VSAPRFLDAEAIARLLPPAVAIDALEAALLAGLDPAADPPRSSVAGAAGELLLMPSSAAGAIGVKLASVAPENPERGRPRIQGLYVLFHSDTLAPAALLDGIALTNVRTAAVSALAVRHLAAAGARRLLVFGTGPQARAHVDAMRAVRPVERVDVVGRHRGRLAAFLEGCRAGGLEASGVAVSAAGPSSDPAERSGLGELVAGAELICCCTTARDPLFGGDLPGPEATVVAVGSHEPGARELDERMLRRSTVVVEDVATALREAGEVIAAVASGALERSVLVNLADLVCGRATAAPGRPRVFKSTGMAWEDLVLAAAAAS